MVEIQRYLQFNQLRKSLNSLKQTYQNKQRLKKQEEKQKEINKKRELYEKSNKRNVNIADTA